MASLEARKALNNLRVQELKVLCKEQSLPTSGRKLDLIDRLVAQREAYQAQLEALSQRLCARAKDTATDSQLSTCPLNTTATSLQDVVDKSLPGVAGVAITPEITRGRGRGRGGSPGGCGRSPGGRGRHIKIREGQSLVIGAGDQAAGSPATSRRRPLRCALCNSAFDLRYTHAPESFRCPSCRFMIMDPFNAVPDPEGMLKLAFVTHSRLDFTLDLPELRRWRREGLSVEVRMVRVDSNKLCHAWPNCLQFVANGSEVFAVKPPEEGHKRRDVPQSVSASLKIGTNAITVHIADACISEFALAVVLTEPRGIPDLSSQVVSCGEAAALARVQKLLSKQQMSCDSASQDIMCLSSDMLKLRCPITMDRVQEPVRGRDCQHLQCFSLGAYLMSNRQMRAFNNRWQCPVCTLILRPADLCRDLYVSRIISCIPEEVEEVVIASDGTWRCRDLATEKSVPSTSPKQQDDVFELDSVSQPSPLPASVGRVGKAPLPALQRELPSPDLPGDVWPVAGVQPSLSLETKPGVGSAKRARTEPFSSIAAGSVAMPIDLDEISDAD